MKKFEEKFGCLVFNDDTMRERLSKEVYGKLKETISQGKELDLCIANAIANAMKDWAIELGATHFTHWFQPMTGITAEKHEAFFNQVDDTHAVVEFSGKELIRGEPDASSFPNGGLRATFEARGYTAWDPTSYAFIKDNTLCIPSVFCSFDGSALDKKTPLLRSMAALNKQAMRIIALFGGDDITRIGTTVGSEQEYFLVDKKWYDKRPDLMLCSRTLVGSKVPRGQELEDHYFGMITPRVKAFMEEVNDELWKLGVFAKTEHKEVAPAQFELAPIFTSANLAADQNQLTMEVLQKVADRHGFVCLLHEKPYQGINGSGKHNNWSMVSDTGVNLLEPGKTPEKNARFLLFLCAIIKAVDEYQNLLRVSVASAGNDHRLGANEAPPAILSIFLGDELSAILKAIEEDIPYNKTFARSMRIGVDALPSFPKDTTDRNRTSPFAFTGNKFEFRMLGSSLSISCPNEILNTIVAEALSQFADELEGSDDFEKALNALIKDVIHKHKRIIFNGNGYGDEWIKEASIRGLSNIKTTAQAIPYYAQPKNMDVFIKHNVLSEAEILARQAILYDTYNKCVGIEASTLVRMVNQDILPATIRFHQTLLNTLTLKRDLSMDIAGVEHRLSMRVNELNKSLYDDISTLQSYIVDTQGMQSDECTQFHGHFVLPLMDKIREACDQLEEIVDRQMWPYPQYVDLLYRF